MMIEIEKKANNKSDFKNIYSITGSLNEQKGVRKAKCLQF